MASGVKLGYDLKLSNLDGKIDTLVKEVKEMRKSMDHFNDFFEKIKKDNELILQGQKDIKEENLRLENRITVLSKEVDDLRRVTEDLMKPSLSLGIEISPVHQKENENLLMVVEKIIRVSQTVINKEDVKSFYRRKPNKKGEPGSVVIKFNSSEKRNGLLKSFREKQIKQVDLGFRDDLRRVYAKEELSQFGRNLYFKALEVKRNLGYKYLWIKDGKIFLRKIDNDRCICITGISDLEKLT